MLYVLFGEDDFSLQEALKRIKGELGGEELLATNTTVLNAQELTLNQLRSVCDTVPFLAPKRLVIVEGLLKRCEAKSLSKAGRKSDRSSPGIGAEWQTLGSYARGMPDTTVLVIIDGKVSNDNPLLKQLSPLAKVMPFPNLRGIKLQQWIQDRVAKGGGSISPSAVKSLAQLVGENLWLMNNEIAKLLLYASGRRIEEADVEQVVSYARQASVFAMADAILEDETRTAQRLLHQLLDDGASPSYLLVMLTRQLRLIVQVKELSAQGLISAEIQNRLGLTSEYVLNKTLGQVRKYSRERLERTYSKLLETDLSIKRGKYSGDLALDILVADLCSSEAKP